VLGAAAAAGAAYVDIELLAADKFFALGVKQRAPSTQFIVSSHDYETTLSAQQLADTLDRMWKVGADVAKIANTATDIADVARMVALPATQPGPVIALSMSERGQLSRILAPKFGSMLTFGALRKGAESAPGQPTLEALAGLYRLKEQDADTPVLGVIGNPIAHSKSPALHNAALAAAGERGCYLPLLVDSLPGFLAAFDRDDFTGFSVTIPHKEAALQACAEVDPVAASIGAVNTLVRLPGGGFKGYNTDWEAAVDAIEMGLGGAGTLSGRSIVVLGAGGAARALVFGALARGASSVTVANRTLSRAQALAESAGVQACAMEEIVKGSLKADVLINTTAVGMHPNEDDTPVPAEALSGYACVFDAIYTPLETRLLREAKAAGAVPVSGLEMFVGQAAAQFTLFTGKEAPVDLMREAVLSSL